MMSIRYLRHFIRHFATEVFLFGEIVCGYVDNSCSEVLGVSPAFSSMATDEMQISFVFPVAIKVV